MPQKSKSSRSYLLIVLIAATFLALGARLVYLQVGKGAFSKSKMERNGYATAENCYAPC